MDKQQLDECLRIVNVLTKLPDSEPFRYPVDYKAFGLFDYPLIVEHPMDLSTVTSNLQKDEYKSPKDFFESILLIWKNCQLYNKDDSQIYHLSIKMENTSKTEMASSILARYIPQYLLTIEHTMNQNTKSQKQQSGGTTSAAALKKKIVKPPKASQASSSTTNNNTQNAILSSTLATASAIKKDRAAALAQSNAQNLAAGGAANNPQEKKYAHISLRLNLAFKLKNVTEDKLVKLFAVLAEKYPETLINHQENHNSDSSPLFMNLTHLPDHIIQLMLSTIE